MMLVFWVVKLCRCGCSVSKKHTVRVRVEDRDSMFLRTLASTYNSTHHHNPEDHLHRCDNFRSYILEAEMLLLFIKPNRWFQCALKLTKAEVGGWMTHKNSRTVHFKWNVKAVLIP